MKKVLSKALDTLGYRLIRTTSKRRVFSHPTAKNMLHQQVVPSATLSPWLTDEAFMAAYACIKEHTLVDIYRCYELWMLAKQLGKLPGCFLEVGVWRGGTGALLAAAAKCTQQERDIFLADTFEGVVKAGENDTCYVGGEHADTSEEIARDLIGGMALNNVHVLKGIFPDDTADKIAQPIALLHCDVDVYQSTKDIVEWAMPRMHVGSVVVFDDYGFSGCEGVARYVHELAQQDDFFFLHNLNGHAVFIKR